MAEISMKIKSFFGDKHNRNRFVSISIIMLFLFVILLSPSFAQLTPVRSVTIESENLSYTDGEQGSWKITKSAKWVSKGKARITLDVESLIVPNNQYTDVILVLDISGSMNESRLSQVKEDTIELINYAIPKGNNIALITFNDTSEIVSDFTDDITILEDSINGLVAVGNTNYYQALVNVDNVLKNYEFKEDRDCVVLFLTDGLPNVDSPNEEAQFQYLKTVYPDLIINSIQYEMGNNIVDVLETMSDNQYNADSINLNEFLYRAAVNPVEYEKFEIVDYIEDEYFTVDDISLISVSDGTVNLDNNEVTWNLDGIKTGSTQQMTIDINLNEELVGVGGVYPTNEKLEVNSVIVSSTEEVTSTLTPILADNYSVIYDGNSPDECAVSGVPEATNVSVFDMVSISTTEPSCEGYQFKGWELVSEEVKQVNSEYFIMPEEDVTLRATWSKLALDKAMDGKISQVQNLYQMMADNSVPDNIASEFVTSSTGINFKTASSDTNGKGIYQAIKLEGENTPIYYYRGDVDNNNLIFANFCWKIVRTTETKGVKLIYNGVPNEDGSCTATGENAQIGTSAFNSSKGSLAYNGYMYGDVYLNKSIRTSIIGLGEKNEGLQNNASSTNYIYSSNIVYGELEDGTYGYTLVDGENRIWNDTYSVDTGNQFLYTCLSETEHTCSEVYYVIQSTEANGIRYVTFADGETADDIWNREIVYGNDVSYDEETGMYTLQTTMTSKIGDWETDRTIIGGENGYHYTCLNNDVICSTVLYITAIQVAAVRNNGMLFYVELNDGKKIETIVNEMTTESEHKISSTIKTYIDTWYASNMKAYTNELEDTTWCNDRTVASYGGWNKGDSTSVLLYKIRKDHDSGQLTLTCRNKNDAYTVDDIENGNGDLTYPVALLTADEINYAGRSGSLYYLYTGALWWTLSPNYYSTDYVYGYAVQSNGNFVHANIFNNHGVRPSVSLKAGTRSIDGDGSPEDPFIVEVKKNITVNYDANGGSFNSDTVNTVTHQLSSFGEAKVVSGEYLEATHEKEYMEFAGWYTDPDCTDGNEFNIVASESGITVYAKWNDTRTAYAIYSEDDSSITFVKDMNNYEVGNTFVDSDGDTKVATEVYTGFETETYSSYSNVPWASIRETITSVEIRDEIKPVSMAYWFYNFKNVPSIDVSKINTSNVTNMSHTFYYLSYNNTEDFKIVGLSNWNTSLNTSMDSMFERTGYSSKTWDIGDISNWDTSNITSMRHIFYQAGYSAEKFVIDVSKWNTSKVTNMSGVFGYSGYSATTWSVGNLSNWDVSSVTNMSFLFQHTGRKSNTWNVGDLSGWNVANVTNMTYLFNAAGYSATTWSVGDLSSWDVSNVTNMEGIFRDAARNATEWHIGNLSDWDVSNVTNMSYMFSNAGQNASDWSIGDLSKWDVSNVTNMYYMFNNAGYSSEEWSVGDLSTKTVTNSDGTTYTAWDVSNVTNMSYMFSNAGYNATYELDLSNWNVNKVTSYDNFNFNVESKVITPTWVN